MKALLSKSDFKTYLQCPEYFWFRKNRPELLEEKPMSDFDKALSEQGKKVEAHVYQMFPDLRIVSSKAEAALPETSAFIQQAVPYIGQAAFCAGGFFAQSDLVHFKADGHIDIYEIKSSSSQQNDSDPDSESGPSKEEHLDELAFQQQVAQRAGYPVDRCFLIELNKNYIRNGDLDLQQLFLVNDLTDQIQKRSESLSIQMQEALEKSNDPIQPVSCACRYKPRKKQCAAFPILHPDMLGYTAHELSRIGSSPKLLRALVDQNVFHIEDIPPDRELTDNHRDQITSWNEDRVIIRRDEIRNALSNLVYPLYFLDYETWSSAIPFYEGTKPYQQVPFQYSLHILPSPEAEVLHREFLHTDDTNPIPLISQKLREDIGDDGSVIVWHKSFEGARNQELAMAVPQFSDFLLGINDRFFDLKEIFSQRMYVHKNFKGSASIKNVLPVLAPQLSYKELPIGDGGTATSAWARMVFDLEDAEEKEIIRKNLLEYCKLDTLAMVEIWRKIAKEERLK